MPTNLNPSFETINVNVDVDLFQFVFVYNEFNLIFPEMLKGDGRASRSLPKIVA